MSDIDDEDQEFVPDPEIELLNSKRITPRCCEQAIKTQGVFLSVYQGWIYGDNLTEPQWVIKSIDQKLGFDSVDQVFYCPFCSRLLPEIIRPVVATTKPICKCIDTGYYCATCKERLHACHCLAPAYAWGPNFYDPNFGDQKLCKCGHHYYRHFDSYEDMNPVGCKYCGINCLTFQPTEAECKHAFYRLSDEQYQDKNIILNVRCKFCDKDFGWCCNSSPDGICHYDFKDGVVNLADGTPYHIDHPTAASKESLTSCIFCLKPKNRN